MLYSLRGKLIYIDASIAVVECGGVGYKCFITSKTYNNLTSQIQSEVFLFTYFSVREDSMDLYGFSAEEELECFKLLTSVSGVGAKVGIGILSSLTVEQILLSISNENTQMLTTAPGVGPKLAQRIILELKDKISNAKNLGMAASRQNITERTENNATKALEALVALGYTQADAVKALSEFSHSLSVEDLIKFSLKKLSGRF
ncbi:MAG: Holliday junction branch migration protein RuvA [Clostridia bacterium]|nr:Holliday junction branch migration protein RuvA [Clostridia bacterium]